MTSLPAKVTDGKGRAWGQLLLAYFCIATSALADVPVPPRVLDPISVGEAWNVIRLATTNIEQLLREGRSSEAVDQISLCSPALRVIARTPVPGFDQTVRDDQTARAIRSVNLIARDSLAGNSQGVSAVFAEWKKVLGELAKGFEPRDVSGEIFHCLDHPENVSIEPGAQCEKCQRRLHPRRIPYSFVYVQPSSAHLKATVNLESPLVAGQEARGTLKLVSAQGQPLPPTDLIITHTHHVHLIITDSKYEDYHLTHGSPVGETGEYTFAFTPAHGGPYRLWAATVPAARGLQEYAMTDLGAQKPAAEPPVFSESQTSAVGDYRFHLSIPSGTRAVTTARAGELQMLRVLVTDAAGKPVTVLEPFMNAFAHITAFDETGETILQLHPAGADILNEQLRGGPTLNFKFYPPKPGNLRLFCTVRIGGKRITAQLGLVVKAAPGQ